VKDQISDLSGTKAWSFSRRCRIVKESEFSSIFRLRPIYKTGHFTLYVRLNEVKYPRLGVVTAKRLAPRAVTRNTIKRIVREFFRTTPMQPIDCIVRLSKPVNAKTRSAKTTFLKQELHFELKKIFTSLIHNV